MATILPKKRTISEVTDDSSTCSNKRIKMLLDFVLNYDNKLPGGIEPGKNSLQVYMFGGQPPMIRGAWLIRSVNIGAAPIFNVVYDANFHGPLLHPNGMDVEFISGAYHSGPVDLNQFVYYRILPCQNCHASNCACESNYPCWFCHSTGQPCIPREQNLQAQMHIDGTTLPALTPLANLLPPGINQPLPPIVVPPPPAPPPPPVPGIFDAVAILLMPLAPPPPAGVAGYFPNPPVVIPPGANHTLALAAIIGVVPNIPIGNQFVVPPVNLQPPIGPVGANGRRPKMPNVPGSQTPHTVDIRRVAWYVQLSVEEILTFLPNHVKWDAVGALLDHNGWTRRTVAGFINMARGLLGHQCRLPNTVGINLNRARAAVPALPGANPGGPAQIPTPDQWNPPVNNVTDVALADMAAGVETAHWPTGAGRRILTVLIEFAVRNPHLNLMFSQVPELAHGMSLINIIQQQVTPPDYGQEFFQGAARNQAAATAYDATCRQFAQQNANVRYA